MQYENNSILNNNYPDYFVFSSRSCLGFLFFVISFLFLNSKKKRLFWRRFLWLVKKLEFLKRLFIKSATTTVTERVFGLWASFINHKTFSHEV